MNTAIEVVVKTHYGTEHMYVVSEHKQAISQLTGKKTVSEANLISLVNLGFEVSKLRSKAHHARIN